MVQNPSRARVLSTVLTLGPIYVATIIYVVGAVVALVGLTQAAPAAAQARR